jgi:hypothetical protein
MFRQQTAVGVCVFFFPLYNVGLGEGGETGGKLSGISGITWGRELYQGLEVNYPYPERKRQGKSRVLHAVRDGSNNLIMSRRASCMGMPSAPGGWVGGSPTLCNYVLWYVLVVLHSHTHV